MNAYDKRIAAKLPAGVRSASKPLSVLGGAAMVPSAALLGDLQASVPATPNPQPTSPALSILAGARNAPVMKVLPTDMVGVPDAVRRVFQSPEVRGAYFPAETAAMKAEREQLEAEGATGFYTPSQ